MYTASKERYTQMEYKRCGDSGLMLPKVSLGLWHNFGDTSVYENMKQMCFTAFDNGITHFDLANNYGPAYGSAERNFGKFFREELHPYRDNIDGGNDERALQQLPTAEFRLNVPGLKGSQKLMPLHRYAAAPDAGTVPVKRVYPGGLHIHIINSGLFQHG